MDECIFCKIVRKEIPAAMVWEDQEFVAFLDVRPLNPGHLLVVPKHHVDYVFTMDDALYSKAFQAAKRLADPLKRATEAQRIGLVVEGFGVDHVHLHMVPINAPHELDPHRAKPATPEELSNMAEKIKQQLV